ncbi:MAG: deoxyribose-phosphate aldolase [Hyphomicrobiales bacterium]
MTDPETTAARVIELLDLTVLSDAPGADAISDLCTRARSPFGPVAAVCIWPHFVAQAKSELAGSPVRVATVANFPTGDEDPAAVAATIAAALANGADEIDLVMPWRALLAGDADRANRLISASRSQIPEGRVLKVILETGELKTSDMIRSASRLALDAGADFIKTSTGKVAVNATPEAARIMITAIREHGGQAGFKAAGGIRTVADAAAYLAVADDIMGPDWAAPGTFRFGASGLLDDVLATLGAGDSATGSTGY